MELKIFLELDGDTEIRRIILNPEEVGTLEALKNKLTSLFPSIKNRSFSISWLDVDGDRIKVGSNGEYQIFLNAAEGATTMKLFVSPEEEFSNQEVGLHEGVTCDGCNGIVCGFRYKCVSCPNIDLCQKCESLGFHPEHFMLRIPVPVSVAGCAGFRKTAKWLGKMNKKCNLDGGGRWSRHREGGHKGGRHCRGEGAQGPEPRQQPPGEGNGEAFFDFSTFVEGLAAPKPPAGVSVDIPRLLGALSQGVINFLDPLGREFLGQGQTSTQSNTQGETPTESQGPQGDRPTGTQAPQPAVPREQPTQTEAEQQPTQAGNGGNGQPVVQEAQETLMETEVSIVGEQRKSSDKSTGGKVQVEAMSTEPSPQTSQSVKGKPSHPFLPPDSSWTVVESPPEKAGPSNTGKPPATNGQTPQFHSERVEESLAKMLSLGFNNEGNWLRRILEAKDGDMQEVLDFLMPLKKMP